MLKKINVEDAVGTRLSHDITEIRPGEFKGSAFRKGHEVCNEDICHLQKLGKNHLYLIDLADDEIHENQAAAILAKSLAGEGTRWEDDPKEGKIGLHAAMDGLLVPIGGFKGVGLALIMGILSSMLSGAAYGAELGDMERGPTAGQDGHFVAAIRVAAFEDVERFKARVDGAIGEIHAARRAPGVDRLYVPGEIEAERREAYLRDGIPLNPVELGDLAETARRMGADLTSYDWL